MMKTRASLMAGMRSPLRSPRSSTSELQDRETESAAKRQAAYNDARAVHDATRPRVKEFLDRIGVEAREVMRAYTESETKTAAVNYDLPPGAHPFRASKLSGRVNFGRRKRRCANSGPSSTARGLSPNKATFKRPSAKTENGTCSCRAAALGGAPISFDRLKITLK